MLPPALLPELLTKGSLRSYGHSALPDAPVRPERPPTKIVRLVSRRRARATTPVVALAHTDSSPVVVPLATPAGTPQPDTHRPDAA
jgi:hypothetical protein